MKDSQAVVFHIPTYADGTVPERSFPDQKFVAFSMESEEYFTSLKSKIYF
jgi:hypothetical protein